MENKGSKYVVNFYIAQYRLMFRRIIIIYILITCCLGYLVYKLSKLEEPQYYAASESGLLKKLTPYSKEVIERFKRG